MALDRFSAQAADYARYRIDTLWLSTTGYCPR